MLIKDLKRFFVFSFLTIFLILSGFFLMPVNAQTQPNYCFKPFKMVFLPDTHVSFKDQDDWILYKESFVIFQDIIKSIKTIPDLDFVVFGGDLTDNDDNTLSDLPLFLDSIEDVNFKYYSILGDRDASLSEGITKQDFCAEFRRNGFGNPNLTYWAEQPSDNTLLIGLDTAVENKFEGKLPPEELLWLDNTLKTNPDKFTVIVMHHPAFQTTASDKTVWKKYILENSDEFLSVINKYPQVKLILSGHHHFLPL
jgi:3',5'-cyclic AMP phosphodiesterase CpdA